ncbi:MAG TPA: DinB family protein [Roseiflexaceae bacterium]
MTGTPLTRGEVLARLGAVRSALRELAARAPERALQEIQVTPEWNAIETLRHMSVWHELAMRCLADWHGSREWMPIFVDEDVFNLEMVAARFSAGLPTVLDGIDAAHRRYAETLDAYGDAELAEMDVAPWREQVTRLHLINELLGHDLEHIGEIDAARRRTPSRD